METDQGELLADISSFLERHQIPYMITGAWSVIYYGRPRASHDIDFVVEIHEDYISHVQKALTTLPTEYLVDTRMISNAVKKRDMFQIVHLPTMLKLDFWILQDEPFDRSRFNRKQQVEILNEIMTISSAEDTILQKLRWYKEAKIEKHLVDAAFVYQIQLKHLNVKYLKKWARFLQVTRYFHQLPKIDLEKYI